MVAPLALAALGGAAADRTVNAATPKRGGSLRIVTTAGSLDFIDPALAYAPASWEVLGASCALLMNRPDKQPPVGYRAVPEVATSWPRLSADRTTYTFTIRRGFRFATGERVTALNFAHAMNRVLNPAVRSPGAQYLTEVVGAQAVLAGRAQTASGISARGNSLTIRLTKPVGDFPSRLTMPFFCPVPTDLPAQAEGVGAPFSGAGPYTISRWVRGRELIAVRNPFYRGRRPHHVDGFVVSFVQTEDAAVAAVERGEADWVPLVPPPLRAGLVRKYGVNKEQYHVRRMPVFWYLALNNDRPLFRNNPHLRQAVNFAIDRRAYLRQIGLEAGDETDQYLPPVVPGFQNARIYPLQRPDVKRARALARGHTRGGTAVLYARAEGAEFLAQAQIVKDNLRRIGLAVQIKTFPTTAFFTKRHTRGEPFDIIQGGWGADYIDPYNILTLFDGRLIRNQNNPNFSHYRSASVNRALDRASRLSGDARYRALGKLDVALARDQAPVVPLFHFNEPALVSRRVGCLVFNGRFAQPLNLAAACLK